MIRLNSWLISAWKAKVSTSPPCCGSSTIISLPDCCSSSDTIAIAFNFNATKTEFQQIGRLPNLTHEIHDQKLFHKITQNTAQMQSTTRKPKMYTRNGILSARYLREQRWRKQHVIYAQTQAWRGGLWRAGAHKQERPRSTCHRPIHEDGSIWTVDTFTLETGSIMNPAYAASSTFYELLTVRSHNWSSLTVAKIHEFLKLSHFVINPSSESNEFPNEFPCFSYNLLPLVCSPKRNKGVPLLTVSRKFPDTCRT